MTQDPQYGGYGLARQEGEDVAGIGPAQDPNAPTAWSLYFGSEDLDALSKQVTDAGGNVVMAPFDVGDQGRMAVFQDPTGAFFSAWQGERMGNFRYGHPNSLVGPRSTHAALSRRSTSTPRSSAGRTTSSRWATACRRTTSSIRSDHAVAGAWEMSPEIPAEVPSYWQVYFNVDDVDDTHRRALELGASGHGPAIRLPGGRFRDPRRPSGRKLRDRHPDRARASSGRYAGAFRHIRRPSGTGSKPYWA